MLERTPPARSSRRPRWSAPFAPVGLALAAVGFSATSAFAEADAGPVDEGLARIDPLGAVLVTLVLVLLGVATVLEVRARRE